MARAVDTARDGARILLALIRIFNGSAALLAPQFLSKRLGIDYEANSAVLYVWRMFGIRTVLIGADLLLQKGERRQEALRVGIIVHASDTLAAYLAGRSGKMPASSARMITAISAVNTALAIFASKR
jgi:hypothetical protein